MRELQKVREPQTCASHGRADSYLLHSDPELRVPVTSPEQAAEAEQAARVGDLVHKGFSRQVARLAQKEISR